MNQKKENKDKQVMTRFTPSQYAEVETVAKEEGRTISNLLNTATMIYVKDRQKQR